MLITLTSDFGVQSQGVGIMEAVLFRIAPETKVIHLMHGLPEFNIIAAARTLETVSFVPVGFHVCVCDPGVGTSRKPIICLVQRGDYLIGPDNGVLIPASRMLGGIVEVREIANPEFMNHPVSPLFHGRDVFAPAAAYLSTGVSFERFGPVVSPASLQKEPYEEATIGNGVIRARVIQINRFGSAHLNIRHSDWDSLGLPLGGTIRIDVGAQRSVSARFVRTFGDVPVGGIVILKDDYGRVELAVNQGSFVTAHSLEIGMEVCIWPAET